MAKLGSLLLLLLVGASLAAASKDVTKLQVGVKHKPKECDVKAKAGDKVSVHYTVRTPIADLIGRLTYLL